MLKKEEVYVRVSSKNKARKLKDVLDMFNQPQHYSTFQELKSFEAGWLNNPKENPILVFEHEEWIEAWLSDNTNKTKVSLKELRNILAREYLKEGDVVLTKSGNDKIIAVVNKTCSSNVALFEAKRWIRLHDGFKWDNKGCFDYFIRYATEEEKQLLKTQESVIDKAISLLHDVIQELEELKNK